jgi:iron complex transport system ATP-binding protein
MTASTLALDVRFADVQAGTATLLHAAHVPVASGQWTAMVGPNGAGKSTLLRVLAGLQVSENPNRTQAEDQRSESNPSLLGTTWTLLGKDAAQWTAKARSRSLAWVAVDGDLLSSWWVRDVVALGRLPHQSAWGAASPSDTQAVDHAMALAQVERFAHRRVGTLSAGEQQRVQLARALATDASVLLMDEPVAHLDPSHQFDWRALMLTLVAQGRTLVTVLHDINLALAAHHVMVLQQGHVIHRGLAGDAATHAAMRQAFDQRLCIERVNGRWRAWVADSELSPDITSSAR